MVILDKGLGKDNHLRLKLLASSYVILKDKLLLCMLFDKVNCVIFFNNTSN